MPLLFAKASNDRRQAFEAGLLHLVRLGRVPAGLVVDPSSQPIWLLNVKDIGGDFHLRTAAHLVSWRYFAGQNPGEVVAGDVSATSPPVVTSLFYGDRARTALNAFQALDRLPAVQASDFEVRLLRIPGALLEGFWLRPPTDESGLIVPFGRTLGDAQLSGKPFPIEDFLKNQLHPVAEQVSSVQAAKSGLETS
jgi:hypothetical protein